MAEDKKLQDEELKADEIAEKKQDEPAEEVKDEAGIEQDERDERSADGQDDQTEQNGETQTDAPDAESGEESKAEPDVEAEGKAESDSETDSEKYMRLLAEFQNFKKRAVKEKSDIHAYANENLVKDLLPVLDNFERALETKTEEVESYAQGMELICQQMKAALQNHGLKEIEAQGEEFDPNKHNAVMTEESEEYESGKVCKVLQKGYELNGRVIRAAMVAVCK